MNQQILPGVFPQKVGANDNVKGVSVQHSAALHHGFAKTNGYIDSLQGMDGSPNPYSYGHSLSFLKIFSWRWATMVSVAPVFSTARKT